MYDLPLHRDFSPSKLDVHAGSSTLMLTPLQPRLFGLYMDDKTHDRRAQRSLWSNSRRFALCARAPVITELNRCVSFRLDLVRSGSRIVVLLSGVDSIYSDTVHIQHTWLPEEILFDVKFADMVTIDEKGSQTIDFSKFDALEPLGDIITPSSP